MKSKTATRRAINRGVLSSQGLDKSRYVVLKFAPSLLSLEEAAMLSFQFRDIESRYNKKRHLLILQFDSPAEKLQFVKRLPQWLWNRGCVQFDFTAPQLNQWLVETIG